MKILIPQEAVNVVMFSNLQNNIKELEEYYAIADKLGLSKSAIDCGKILKNKTEALANNTNSISSFRP